MSLIITYCTGKLWTHNYGKYSGSKLKQEIGLQTVNKTRQYCKFAIRLHFDGLFKSDYLTAHISPHSDVVMFSAINFVHFLHYL